MVVVEWIFWRHHYVYSVSYSAGPLRRQLQTLHPSNAEPETDSARTFRVVFLAGKRI